MYCIKYKYIFIIIYLSTSKALFTLGKQCFNCLCMRRVMTLNNIYMDY